MKNKKRVVGALVVFCLAATMIMPGIAAGVVAEPAAGQMTVNGKPANVEAYVIEGNNYVQVRDLAEAANFGVAWNPATKGLEINTSASYAPDKQNTVQYAKLLDENNWAPETRARLNAVIQKNGIQSPNYDSANKPYTVFDCDNTTVANDVEEALLIYQIEKLAFKIKPDQMMAVIETGIPDVNKQLNDNKMSTADLATDIAKDYAYLYKNYSGFGAGGKMTLEEVQKTNEYLDFRAKLRFVYEGVNATFDASVGYPWVTYLFTGMTHAEVKALATESHDYWQAWAEPWAKVKWTSPDALAGKAGVVSTSYKTGLLFPVEMKDLYNTLMQNGIDVYVCSASFQPVIEAIANPKYGYNFKEENVFAMRLKTDANGRFINEYDTNYFQTQGKGKSHTINAFIRGQYDNRGPILVAGDSAGDFNMMTEYKDTQVSLIINRVRSDNFKEISQEAARTIGNADARYILQGRDDNTGLYRPTEKSIALGETEEKLTK